MKLLLVDDDKISIDILSEIIKPYLPEFEDIICAYDGHDAYDIIISIKPDVILTDIKMPKLGGIELIKKIRTIQHYDPSILIISSYSDFEYAREALKLSVCDYIVKPVDQDELVEKIHMCLKDGVPLKESKDESIFEKVQTYISEHLDIQLRLSDISDIFHYNAAYLGRLIKEKTDYHFNDYVLKLRMIKAQSLLSNDDLLIHEISRLVGFKDPEHFTKRFKQCTGYTPTEYRNKQK